MRAALLIGLCACGLWADTYPRQPEIDVRHYVFRVTLSDESPEISGEATVTVRFTTAGVGGFRLDLAQPMNVDEVREDGTAVPFTHTGEQLRIPLAAAPAPGSGHEFTIRYHGVPAAGLKIATNKYGEKCFFSENWPDLAHQWLPTIDHPYDKATGEFFITAPVKYQVVANGALEEQIDLGDGRRTTHWSQRVPIATWLYNIEATQFDSRHFGAAAGVPLESWLYHQDRDAGIATLEEPLRRAIEFFSAQVGPYPYQKLAGVEAPIQGGMEHASEIFFGERAFTGRPADSLVAHETAHQWFGDSVTEKDWDDVWLSEGFATYFALLETEHYQGREAFLSGLRRARVQVLVTERRMPGVSVVQSKPWNGIPNQIVYQKGAWVLHLVRGQIGTEKFWAGIREYYRRFRDGNASTTDFRKVIEEVSGQDLGWFFQQWLYRAGSPVLEGTWHYDAARRQIEIGLEQTQAGEAYRLPLEVGIDGAVEKIEMRAKRQTFVFPAAHEPVKVELDPDTWMLMEAKFERR
ncbi:MAG TPA: M1 family aminopeptidase [Bryobacteraceae bacterium]|nr:M1 family aminopeptidase [Bryobacteraceae bacterium]